MMDKIKIIEKKTDYYSKEYLGIRQHFEDMIMVQKNLEFDKKLKPTKK